MSSMGKILFAQQDGVHILKFEGDVRVMLGPTISVYLKSLTTERHIESIVIDLKATTGIDSTALGLLSKISLLSQEQFNKLPVIVSTNPDITHILKSTGFSELFLIVTEDLAKDNLENSKLADASEKLCEQLSELPTHIVSEAVLCEQMIEAHKALMSLNETNLKTFKQLVELLEKEQAQLTGANDAESQDAKSEVSVPAKKLRSVKASSGSGSRKTGTC